jgi:hypothetical protein
MRRTRPAVHETIGSGRIADAPVPTEDGREEFDHARVYAILADDYPDMPLPRGPSPIPSRPAPPPPGRGGTVERVGSPGPRAGAGRGGQAAREARPRPRAGREAA